ncbi:hypothetical protein BDF14DRAFT_378839 [Spinellus fusiger]|nr:hypothetical protein BDF14DRAFT_378839 [Spinellus fusiger]
MIDNTGLNTSMTGYELASSASTGSFPSTSNDPDESWPKFIRLDLIREKENIIATAIFERYFRSGPPFQLCFNRIAVDTQRYDNTSNTYLKAILPPIHSISGVDYSYESEHSRFNMALFLQRTVNGRLGQISLGVFSYDSEDSKEVTRKHSNASTFSIEEYPSVSKRPETPDSFNGKTENINYIPHGQYHPTELSSTNTYVPALAPQAVPNQPCYPQPCYPQPYYPPACYTRNQSSQRVSYLGNYI